MSRECYRDGGCGPYEQLSCSQCPASKKSYLEKEVCKNMSNDTNKSISPKCNCVNEKSEQMKNVLGYDDISFPVELLSGRMYITATVKVPGEKKNKDIPILLSRCPFCGKMYE